MRTILLSTVLVFAACGGGQTPPPATSSSSSKPPPPAAPAGPTRTDFQQIAKSLVNRCVAGGWINEWRSKAPNVDAAKPRIYLREFEDKTGQNLDPTYLQTTLEKKMRTSGVFEMVTESDAFDFIGRGRLLRLAERTQGGGRISVYTVTLEMLDPATNKVAYSCEATVKGEM